MRNSLVFMQIGVFTGILLLFSCAQNQEKPQQHDNPIKEWKFVKTISFEDIAPIGIVADDNFLWLSDVDNNRLVKINFEGKIIEEVAGFERPMHLAIEGDKIYIPEYTVDSIKILEKGSISNFDINEPTDAIGAVSVSGNKVAIADFYKHRILLQEENKTIIIGKKGHGDGALYYPTDVQIKDYLIYVADAYNNRVQVFDLNGKYVQMIGWNENIKVATGLKVTKNQVAITDFEGNRVLIYNLEAKLLQILSGEFDEPSDIEIAGNMMYVTNYRGKSISVYKSVSKP